MKRIFAVLLLLLATGCGGEQPPPQNADTPEPAQNATTSTPTPGETSPESSAGTVSSDETPEEATTDTASGGEGTPRGPVVRISTSGGEEVVVRVEIADDNAERAQGLMDRRSLPENTGMLFAYGNEQELSFWMRNTYIPLSIAFADAEGRIVDLQDMEPLDDEPPSYVSAEPAQYALEVNQGFFEERGVEVGDKMELPRRFR